MNTLDERVSVIAPDRAGEHSMGPSAAAIILLVIVTGLNLWNTIQLGSMASSLRAERQRIEDAVQADGDQQAKLVIIRREVIAQHADLITQQRATAKLSAENLRLVSELNSRLRKVDD